jgi:hypothetical protein
MGLTMIDLNLFVPSYQMVVLLCLGYTAISDNRYFGDFWHQQPDTPVRFLG